MLRRITWLLVAIPSAIVLLALSVANKHPVRLSLDPFRDLETSALAISAPFYAYLFAALTLGVILGGMAAWMGQGRWRKTARVKSQDAMRWQAEADRLTRERDTRVTAAKQLVAVNR
jgi:hypothetical protein